MSETGLKLTVAADLSNLVAGMKRGEKSLNDFQNQLKRFQNELSKAAEPTSILRLNNAIDATQRKIKSISTGGLDASFKNIDKSAAGVAQTLGNNITKGSNQAGNALQNLGRIAQDAPFGFIGIQNNLNPLLESFQRLKVETGSTSGALKALGGSLIGGAGIGLAISVVTGLLTVLAQNGFFKSAKAADEAKASNDAYYKSLQQFKDAQRDVAVGIEEQRIKLQSLVAVARGDIGTKFEQAAALKELNKLIPDNIGVLTQQNIKTAEGVSILSAYVRALEARATAELYINRIAELNIKSGEINDKQIGNRVRAIQKERDAKREIDRIDAALRNSRGKDSDLSLITRRQELESNLLDIQKELGKQSSFNAIEASRNAKEIENLRKKYLPLVAAAENLSEVEIEPIKEKAKVNLEAASTTISDLYKELAAIKGQFDIGFLSFKEADVERIRAYQKAFDELLKSGEKADGNTILNLRAELNFTVPNLNQEFSKKVKELADSMAVVSRDKGISEAIKPVDITVPVKPSLVLTEFEEQAINLAAEINAILKSTMENAFASIADGIADVITGGSIGDAFKSILSAVGDGISQLGKALVAAGIAKTALEKFALVPGPQTVLAGIGIQILGQVLKKSLPKFGAGGIVTGPMQAIVGEAGPEAIIPLSKLDKIIAGGGGSQQLSGEFVVRGNDLILALQRAQQSKNRLG